MMSVLVAGDSLVKNSRAWAPWSPDTWKTASSTIRTSMALGAAGRQQLPAAGATPVPGGKEALSRLDETLLEGSRLGHLYHLRDDVMVHSHPYGVIDRLAYGLGLLVGPLVVLSNIYTGNIWQGII